MNKFLIFAGFDYEASGGAVDLIGAHEKLFPAQRIAEQRWEPTFQPGQPDQWVPQEHGDLMTAGYTSPMHVTVRSFDGRTDQVDYSEALANPYWHERLIKGFPAGVVTKGWVHVLDVKRLTIWTPTTRLIMSDNNHAIVIIDWTEEPCL